MTEKTEEICQLQDSMEDLTQKLKQELEKEKLASQSLNAEKDKLTTKLATVQDLVTLFIQNHVLLHFHVYSHFVL